MTSIIIPVPPITMPAIIAIVAPMPLPVKLNRPFLGAGGGGAGVADPDPKLVAVPFERTVDGGKMEALDETASKKMSRIIEGQSMYC
jgi:hypothetical protein